MKGDAGPLAEVFHSAHVQMDGLFRNPNSAEELLFRPKHSIIDQSLHSRMGATTTNGDGFGIGWYGEGAEPAVLKV